MIVCFNDYLLQRPLLTAPKIMTPRPARLLLSLLLLPSLLALTACGTKTPLVRPPGPAPAPVLGMQNAPLSGVRHAATHHDHHESARNT